MLHHPILDKLEQLRFTGMAAALREQRAQTDVGQLTFMERFGLLIDREESMRYKLTSPYGVSIRSAQMHILQR